MVEVVEISAFECNWIFWIFFYFNTKLRSKVGMIMLLKHAFKPQSNIHSSLSKWLKYLGLSVIGLFGYSFTLIPNSETKWE